MVASFDERKDFETLIRAAIALCTTDSSYVFLLMGSGPLLEVLRAAVPLKLIENRQIIFTGKRNDIESVLQIIDVGVLMTNPANHGEGVSNSIIEYMASAKPVIATRGGGTDEVVIDQYNGFLIEPRSESALIEKIEMLFNNRKLGATLGENGRKYVLENFELGKKSAEYIVLYRNLIGKTG
jgi:glycosyltransferase involved in cell wall biosynthesis